MPRFDDTEGLGMGANTTNPRRTAKSEGFPNPSDYEALKDWLGRQRREWAVILGVRAALRVVPLVKNSRIILPVFCAAATARFAVRYPKSGFGSAEVSAAATAAYALAFTATTTAEAGNANAALAAVDAVFAAGVDFEVATPVADAVSNAIHAARSARVFSAAFLALKDDFQQLRARSLTPAQLAVAPLWRDLPPPRITGAWEDLAERLRARGEHWSIWTDWYGNVSAGAGPVIANEQEDAAFTDLPGKLPWDSGPKAVNDEITRRLEVLWGGLGHPLTIVQNLDADDQKREALARLAEMASPQPFITDKGQLGAGPNKPFDIPTIDDDLSTLPIRQRNLIAGILRDLPANAPKHLKDFLQSYHEELKARGVQPILGVLKDDADIIAASVTALRAEDEWLEPGMRKAFDRFAENHKLFVKHFPLDAEREAVYAATPVDEENATGKKFTEPFEKVAEAARDAHNAGTTTDDFMMVIDKMTKFARVVATTPSAAPPDKQSSDRYSEIRISPDDRIPPVTSKKRVILGSLGFYVSTLSVISAAVTVTASDYAVLVKNIEKLVEMLTRLIQ